MAEQIEGEHGDAWRDVLAGLCAFAGSHEDVGHDLGADLARLGAEA